MQNIATQYQYYHANHDSQQHIRAETFTHELKRLLAGNDHAFNDESVRRQVTLLEHWMNYYRRGLVSAYELSAAGILLLNDLRNRLKLSEEPLPRLTNEGNNPVSRWQEVETDEIVRAIRRSEKVIRGLRGDLRLLNHH